MTYLHSSVDTPMRSAMKQMLREFNASHVFTLAFHELINMPNATAKISRWYRNVMHRLFGRRCFQLSPSQSIEFLLLPEGGTAALHFHGLIRVPPEKLAYFERYAIPHWKNIAQKGTLDFRLVDQDKYEGYLPYITAGCEIPEYRGSILHSSMLHHFVFKAPESASTESLPSNSAITHRVATEVLHEPAPTSA